MSESDPNYLLAVAEAKKVEANSQGFAKTPVNLGSGDASRTSIQQNNVIIQLLINLHSRVDIIEEELNTLKRGKATEAQAATAVDVDELASKLSQLELGRKKREGKGKFYAFKDPYKILAEEQEKAKKDGWRTQ